MHSLQASIIRLREIRNKYGAAILDEKYQIIKFLGKHTRFKKNLLKQYSELQIHSNSWFHSAGKERKKMTRRAQAGQASHMSLPLQGWS